MPNNQGMGFVDYVLWGDDGKPLALIEAKRTTKSAKRRPAAGQALRRLPRSDVRAAPGHLLFQWLRALDLGRREPIRRAPSRASSRSRNSNSLIQRRTSRKKLAEAVINSDIVERYYQTRSIRRVGETFEVDNQRKALVVMATGAGKTRTVIALADVLMRCNWAKRVLFLADRVALVNQAVNAFKTHLPDSSPVNLVTEKATEGPGVRVDLSDDDGAD